MRYGTRWKGWMGTEGTNATETTTTITAALDNVSAWLFRTLKTLGFQANRDRADFGHFSPTV